MSSIIIITCIVLYFCLLFLISYLTGKNDSNETFFLGNRNSPWYIVAYGMIGTTLSGITFISVPGWVASSQFSYLQMVFGFFVGYFVIARILLPLYYRLELTSIYTYLKDRLGNSAYKTGSSFFLLSRTIGASFRLYLIATVLQFAVFDAWDIPFAVTVIITIALIWLYTYRSGIKTIIWTDTLQTTFMLATVIIIAYTLASRMDLNFVALTQTIANSDYSKAFFFEDWTDSKYFFKQFFSGMFMAIVMTGLDQDQMQKNLSCRNLKDAQKNMLVFSSILIIVDLLFLSLGALLYIYSNQFGIVIPANADMLFPNIALNSGLPLYVGILFIIGIIAAAYSSADSALTSLTTSFCVDILEFQHQEPNQQIKTRKYAHLFLSVVLLGVILLFNAINDQSVIKSLFTVAGYTYGPLLGLYSFGLFTQWKVKDRLVPLVAVSSPIICYIIKKQIPAIGFELLIINGAITFLGLCLLSIPKRKKTV
ncbi:MAG: sodium:solute symporter [Flavobacteriales bacterium TMED123]|nr:MAG: sodium:solute symporter [Flavobacteriales bacterium TMED123]|tara:strand:- start:3337 stop:4779 length:1443 start_codon:yes stop_codon:yes gene_type:complete